MVLSTPVELVVALTLGVLVASLLGLLAALLSKASRDIRESWYQRKLEQYRSALENPATVSNRLATQWRRYGGLRRVALLTALMSLDAEAERTRPVASQLPQRDRLADSFVRHLRSKSSQRRGLALLLLGHVGRPQDTHMIAARATDRDGDVRLCAIRALDELATTSAFECLVQLLASSSNLEGQNPLAQARIVERLAKPWAQPMLADAFAEIEPPSRDVSSEDTVTEIQIEQAAQLATPGELEGNATALGIMRAVAISMIDFPLPMLEPWLRYGTVDERAAAVRAIAASNTDLPELIVAATDDPSAVVRAQAIRAIGQLQVTGAQLPEVLAVLETRMTDPDWWVRGYAAQSLATLGTTGLFVLQQIAAGDDVYAAERAGEQLALSAKESAFANRMYAVAAQPSLVKAPTSAPSIIGEERAS